jgi:hypothetical protein
MPYRAIVNGKIYNTATATEVCDLECNATGRGDFHWHDTTLYRTKKGAFFVAGRGGPMSMWAESVNNGRIGGAGVRPVSEQEARDYMEAAGCDDSDFEAAGLPIEEA